MSRAVVCFGGPGNHWLARWLRPGFRHVWVFVLAEHGWVLVDPRNGTPSIEALYGPGVDVVAIYRGQGVSALEVETREIEHIWPLMLNNCVAVTKLVIGLRAPFVWTPWQLYRRLQKENRQ